VNRTVAFVFLLLATAAAGRSTLANAADVEVGEQAGEAIGRLAETVRDFRLTSLPSDLHVQARSMEFDFRQGQLLYKGAVAVKHGDVRMHADELKITFQPKNPREVQRIEARGEVRVDHETETARGRLAVYDPKRATITLTGDAELGSGPNTVQGEKVVVFLDEGRAIVEGGDSGPVRAYIEPDSKSLEGLTKKKDDKD
jgi:lipopolysaccharide export system protein LptA